MSILQSSHLSLTSCQLGTKYPGGSLPPFSAYKQTPFRLAEYALGGGCCPDVSHPSHSFPICLSNTTIYHHFTIIPLQSPSGIIFLHDDCMNAHPHTELPLPHFSSITNYFKEHRGTHTDCKPFLDMNNAPFVIDSVFISLSLIKGAYQSETEVILWFFDRLRKAPALLAPEPSLSLTSQVQRKF